MENVLMTLLIIVSVLIIIAVILQPSKQQDALSALSGGGSDLFTSRKSRGFESFMEKVTTILGLLFFALAIALIFIETH